MRSGDVLTVDFGIPIGSEPGFTRPAIVVTADLVLEGNPRTLHVVPVTTNAHRSLRSEVPVAAWTLDRPSVAQCHLCTVIGITRIADETGGNVGPASVAQIRSIIADLLDVP